MDDRNRINNPNIRNNMNVQNNPNNRRYPDSRSNPDVRPGLNNRKNQVNYNNRPNNINNVNNPNKRNEPNIGLSNKPAGNIQNKPKKFVVHIDDENLNYSPENKSPSDSSSVYFSNYKGRKAEITNNKAGSFNSQKQVNPEPRIVAEPKKQSGKKKKRKKKHVGGRFAIILFVLIIICTSTASYISISAINDVLAITTTGQDDVEVKIPENATYDQIIDILAENGLVKMPELCKIFARFRNLDNTKKYKYLSGIYSFDRSMGVEGMLLKCMAAPQTADTIKLSFPEGWTIIQIFDKLDKYDVCSKEKLKKSLDNAEFEYEFVNNVKKDPNKYQTFEGYLFPDTYDFYLNADANYVIRKFFSSFQTHWTEDYQKRADSLGYSMDEIITIASIIQKEAADEKQMKLISSIIHNRLKNSVTYPTLGCDSTTVYITNYVTREEGIAKGKHFEDLYNTSANKGLPPGPICNPGQDAIEAALYPEETDYYFFLHDSKGKIYLAKTQKEHDENIVLAIKASGN